MHNISAHRTIQEMRTEEILVPDLKNLPNILVIFHPKSVRKEKGKGFRHFLPSSKRLRLCQHVRNLSQLFISAAEDESREILDYSILTMSFLMLDSDDIQCQVSNTDSRSPVTA